MTDKTNLDDRASLDTQSPLRSLVASDVLEAAASRLMPLSGKVARGAKWLPAVLRNPELAFSTILNSDYVAVVVQSRAGSQRMDNYWTKTGIEKFEGLFTVYPQRAVFNVNAQFIEFGRLTLKDGPICVHPDASVTLHDIGVKGHTRSLRSYDYVVPLAFALRFGTKTRPLTAGSYMDALIAYSLSRWRQHAST